MQRRPVRVRVAMTVEFLPKQASGRRGHSTAEEGNAYQYDCACGGRVLGQYV